jgi:hypothetical protein
MKQNLEDQVTILNAKLLQSQSKIVKKTCQVDALSQSLRGTVQVAVRNLSHREEILQIFVDYLHPVKAVDHDIAELYSILYYRGATSSDYPGLALSKSNPPPPPVQGDVTTIFSHPRNTRALRDADTQRLHVTYCFDGLSDSPIYDPDKLCDELGFGVCKTTRIAPCRIWIGDIRPGSDRGSLLVDIGISESDDMSAKSAVDALKELLIHTEAVLQDSRQVSGCLKPRDVKAVPTGIAKYIYLDDPIGNQGRGKLEPGLWFITVYKVSPVPPPSGWGADCYEICFLSKNRVPVATHISDSAIFNEHLALPADIAKVEFANIWQSKDGSQLHRQVIGSTADVVELKTGTIKLGDYSLEIDVYSANKHE